MTTKNKASKPTENKPEPLLLHLDAPRSIALTSDNHPYRWTFRRILRADWETFFRAMATEATYIGGDTVETQEIVTAMMVLAQTTVTAVNGYRNMETLPKDWQTMLPPRHLYSFGLALRDVGPSRAIETEGAEISDVQTVKVDCTWTCNEKNEAVQFTQLTHSFESPTIEQMRAYSRKCNTTRIKGNGRSGTTIYPVRQLAMMDLYDELILNVDPLYCVHGKPLPDRHRDVIAQEMDGAHKVAAIQAFLSSNANDGAGLP